MVVIWEHFHSAENFIPPGVIIVINFLWGLSSSPIPGIGTGVFLFTRIQICRDIKDSECIGTLKCWWIMLGKAKLYDVNPYEANTNTVPRDITRTQHQKASWQVCWWAQTRLRVKTQLFFPSDILNFCPTKSSHILSGLENLPFSPQGN